MNQSNLRQKLPEFISKANTKQSDFVSNDQSPTAERLSKIC